MTTPTPDEICERLRASAEHAAKALQIMADAKTARQTDRDDYPEVRAMVGGYGAPTKEQTLEWKAADLIQQQLAEIERLSAALERAEIAMTCGREDSACYCPNCDNSFYEPREEIRTALGKDAK